MMDAAERAGLIAQYKAGPEAVRAALEGITEQELDARPAPGTWSPREIVHHLGDAEMRSAIRLRRLLAEDAPVILGYDQDEYARRLRYDRPIAASLAAFAAARASTGELLDLMTEADWQRAGTHSEMGAYPAETWLRIYAAHAHGHADQIRRARAAARR
jgi:hypothetical protein